MSLSAGTRLGPYEILSPLGAGGMGEVYLAKDTKLGRNVAIKILRSPFALHGELLQRFDREARLLASLNHPHIGSIYGFEEAEGVRALVLELVEGETLAERLDRGPIPVKEMLKIARQICDALDAAHETGIVHRDLKPANIKITPDGVVKVLDFGVAKVGDRSAGEGTHVPTMIEPTREGMLLGTASYMSPEQARARAVDKRTDIWAFGCVLHEMLTGKRAFGGEDISDTMVAVLRDDPDWTALPTDVPPAIRRLLKRCLEKDLKLRLRDIGDARLEIEDALAGATDGTASGLPTAPRRDVHVQRLTDFIGMKESPAISLDGKMVGFVALVNGRRQIWIRLLAGGASLQVTRDEAEHEHPRWTPDSSGIIYYASPATSGEEGALLEIAALGGPPRRLASAIGGSDISHDGRRIAIFRPAGDHIELVVLAREGSHAERVTLLPRKSAVFLAALVAG